MNELKHQLRDKRIIIPLIVILALGAFLRFHRIEYQSLSNDELSSWKRSGYEDLPTMINEGARPDVHPPAYYILLHFVQKLFGDSERALRFPSALFGVLSILVIFLIGLRVYSYREGILSAVLMAVLQCPVFYSQDARAYSMLLFFTLLSSYCWILMYETLSRDDRPRRGALIAYAATAAICAHTHYFGTYLIALHGIFTVVLFVRRRRALLAVLLVYIAIAVVFLPWIPIMREHLARGPIWIQRPRGGFVHSFFEYLTFICNDSATVRNITFAVLLLLLARTYGEFTQNPTRKNARTILTSPGAVLLLWLVVPFAGVYIKSVLSTPVLTTRNLIISLPPACLLFSRSVMRVPVRPFVHTILICLAAALLTYHLLFPAEYYSKIVKDQFKHVVQYLMQENRLAQCPMIVANAHDVDYLNYYFKHFGSDRSIDVLFSSQENWETVREMIDARKAECIWYIHAGRREEEQHYLLRKSGFEMTEHVPFFHTDIRLYEKRTNRRGTAAPGLQSARTEIAEESAQGLWNRAMKRVIPLEKIELYRHIADRFPEDRYAPQALLMIGFIYSDELGDTLRARMALEELIERYPESNLIDSARRMIENLDRSTQPFEIIIEENE